MKIIGAALGAVLLIFAITINSTTSNINTEVKSGGSVTQKYESGIWLNKENKPGDVDKWDDSKLTYCDSDEDTGNCAAGKDSDCCKALASKCKTLKAFAVIGENAATRTAYVLKGRAPLCSCCAALSRLLFSHTHAPPHQTTCTQVLSRRLDRSLGS